MWIWDAFAIWYHLHNLKNEKNTHGGVLLLVSCRLTPATLLKITLFHGFFPRSLNCTNIPNRAKHHYGKIVLVTEIFVNLCSIIAVCSWSMAQKWLKFCSRVTTKNYHIKAVIFLILLLYPGHHKIAVS